MQIPILVEPIPSGRFCARAGEPFAVHAEGSTAEEAIRLIQQILVDRARNGAYCVAIEVPNGVPDTRPGSANRSDDISAQDDMFFRELREEMAENRKLEDEADIKRLTLENGGA
jgi:hypothetical protein